MTEPARPAGSAGLLTGRKAVVNLVGFAVGLALFAWIVVRAVEGGDWERIRTASPWLVAALLGCTAVSALANGTTFWVTIQPVRRLRFADLQYLNLVANLLNYAPFRLGAVARVMYHMRVDRLALLEIGAWIAMIGGVLILGVGACVTATLVRGEIDVVWAIIAVVLCIAGGFVARLMGGFGIVSRHGRGIDLMLGDHRALWCACVLRFVDIGAFTGRMAAALTILGIALPASDVVVLALVALMASLIPFGRLGFREFCVATAAPHLSADAAALDVPWEQLALVESAGEAIFFLPVGGVLLFWFRRKWIEAGRHPSSTLSA